MTQYKNIFGSLLIAALLPMSYLVINPYGAIKVSVLDEQKINISDYVSFWGKSTHGSRIMNANSFNFSSDKTGTASARIEFSAPVDLYQNSIVLFTRCKQADELLKLTLTDRNSFTTVHNAVEPVAAGSRWAKVVITGKGLSEVWNIDKSKITAIRLTSEKESHAKIRVVEIKNIALRQAARYNQ
jgi:hypothetical protein